MRSTVGSPSLLCIRGHISGAPGYDNFKHAYTRRVLPAAVLCFCVVGASSNIPGEYLGVSDVNISSMSADVQDIAAVAPLPKTERFRKKNGSQRSSTSPSRHRSRAMPPNNRFYPLRPCVVVGYSPNFSNSLYSFFCLARPPTGAMLISAGKKTCSLVHPRSVTATDLTM